LIQTFDQYNFQWDGNDFNDNAVPEGVYFYKIHYKLIESPEEILHGFVHVVLK